LELRSEWSEVDVGTGKREDPERNMLGKTDVMVTAVTVDDVTKPNQTNKTNKPNQSHTERMENIIAKQV
jgi:hypothetical protein